MSTLISLTDIWLRRSERELYSGLHLELSVGELAWLCAPNGRGKTTLLRIIAGLLVPDQGQLRWKQSSFRLRHEEERTSIGLLDEKLGLTRDLSVLQNLQYFAALSDVSEAKTQAVIQRMKLESLAERAVGQLSTGQKKRVSMARMMLEDAQLWLLDEPANGLDAANRDLLCEIVSEHVESGGCCLFTSHDALPFDRRPASALQLDDLCAA